MDENSLFVSIKLLLYTVSYSSVHVGGGIKNFSDVSLHGNYQSKNPDGIKQLAAA